MPVDVAAMLRWRVPPIMILLVLLLKLSGQSVVDALHFCEVFAGGAEISQALRRATWLSLK